MFILKQSTAITYPIFCHDADGDAVTGLVDAGFTKRISKNGGAFAAMTVTITEMENGWYSVPIGTGHTDTLGILSITFTHSSIKQVNLQFRISARINDDLAWPTTSGRSIDVNGTGNVAIDLDDTTGSLAKDTEITGFEAYTAARGAYLDELAAANIPTDVDTLLTRLSAARAGYLDELAAANMPTDLDAVLADTNELQADWANGGRLDLIQDELTTNIDTVETNIAALNDLSAAQVNAEVVDALNVDTYAEPGQEAPAATNTLATKIGYIFKYLRNKITTTATQISVYNDAGSTIDQKSTHSDDGTTYTRGEFGSGP